MNESIVSANIHPKLSLLADFFGVGEKTSPMVIKGFKIDYFDETGCYHIDNKQFKTPDDVSRFIDEN